MTLYRLFGIVTLIVGGLAIYFGYQDAHVDFATRTLDGYIDKSRYYMFGGIGAAVVGMLLMLFAPKPGQGRR